MQAKTERWNDVLSFGPTSVTAAVASAQNCLSHDLLSACMKECMQQVWAALCC